MKTIITFTVKGIHQGRFKGNNERDVNSNINSAIKIDYEIILPIDISSGLASGKKQHYPITLTHPVGASSPQLYNALVTHENLSEVVIEFYTRDENDADYLFYRIKLHNASISRIYQYTENMEFLEDISFVFQTIEEIHIPTSLHSGDNWVHKIVFTAQNHLKPEEKPLLTDGALNRFFAECEEERNDGPLNEAIADTRSFVEKYFSYISPQQRDRIAKLKREEWGGIQAILSEVKQGRGSVEFKFINKPGIPEIVQECAIQTRLLEKGNTQAELRKFVIE